MYVVNHLYVHMHQLKGFEFLFVVTSLRPKTTPKLSKDEDDDLCGHFHVLL